MKYGLVLLLLLALSGFASADNSKADMRVSLYGVGKIEVFSKSSKSVVFTRSFTNRYLSTVTNKGPQKGLNIFLLTNIFSDETNFVLTDLEPGWYEVRVENTGISNIDTGDFFRAYSAKRGAFSDDGIFQAVTNAGGIPVARGYTYQYRLYPGIESSFVFRNGNRFEWVIDGEWLFGGYKSRFITNDALDFDGKTAQGLYRGLWDYVKSADKESATLKLVSNYESLKTTPYIQGSHTLFFFTNRTAGGTASMYWGPGFEYFSAVKGSGIYFKSMDLKPDVFLEYKYHLVSDKNDEWIEDASNPFIKNIEDLGKGNAFVIYPPIFDRFTNTFSPETYTRGLKVKRGDRVTNIVFTNAALGGQKVIHVYLPPSYTSEPNRNYPVIYATDGQMYDAIDMQYSLDALCKRSGKEFLFVMIDTKNRGQEMQPYDIDFTRTNTQEYTNFMNRMTKEWKQTRLEVRKFFSVGVAHDRYIADTVIPFVDGNFRTLADRKHRAYMGQSWGGQKAFDTAFKFPELYGVVISQSPVTRDFKTIAKEMAKQDITFFCSYGTYDLEEIGSPKNVRILTETAKKYFPKVKIEEYSGGHNPFAWILEMDSVLSFIF